MRTLSSSTTDHGTTDAVELAPEWRAVAPSFDESLPAPRLGAGACSKCNCPQWEGNGNQCNNCGHSYEAHW